MRYPFLPSMIKMMDLIIQHYAPAIDFKLIFAEAKIFLKDSHLEDQVNFLIVKTLTPFLKKYSLQNQIIELSMKTQQIHSFLQIKKTHQNRKVKLNI